MTKNTPFTKGCVCFFFLFLVHFIWSLIWCTCFTACVFVISRNPENVRFLPFHIILKVYAQSKIETCSRCFSHGCFQYYSIFSKRRPSSNKHRSPFNETKLLQKGHNSQQISTFCTTLTLTFTHKCYPPVCTHLQIGP